MTRRRAQAEPDRPDRSRLRSRRRRRRLVRGLVKGAFWTLLLAGVFVLGIGYGSMIAGTQEQSREQVSISRDASTVEATLPTETVTVTRTVRAPARRETRRGSAAR